MYTLKLGVNSLLLALVAVGAGLAVSAGEDGPSPHMMYFYNPTCRLCTRTNEVVAAVEEKYAGRMSNQRFNIADSEVGTDNVLYLFELMDEMEVPEAENPTLVVFLGHLEEEDGELFFIPKRVLLEDNIIEKLEEETETFLSAAGKGGFSLGATRPAIFFSHTALASLPVPELDDHVEPAAQNSDAVTGRPSVRPRVRGSGDGDDVVTARAQSQLQFGAISAAALADSVNPCAFATIIILVAMMSSAKRSKNEIIAVCLAFTFSVFLTYFAIGLFLYKIIAEINARGGWFLVAADIVYYVAFALCVIFAILSLLDAYNLFSGRSAEEMVLQLPKAFKKRINVAMARGVRARWLVAGVFASGVIVSFLEAACTGQVYLPTIITLAKIPFWQSMALLAWYNFLFVLPLLIIFGLVLVGVTSEQLATFFKKNVAWTKLALGLVFIIMGAVIWFEMYWPPGYRG